MATPVDLKAQRRRRPRRSLSRERVLRAGLEITETSGLEALSMRRLAEALGVQVMTLYYWVASKDDLLDGIVDLVLAEFVIPEGRADWKARLRASILSAHEALERHPWACPFLMSPRRIRPARLEFIEAILRQLSDAGLSAELVDHAYHALDSHLLGSTLWEAGYSVETAQVREEAQAALLELVLATYPAIAAHVAYHGRPRHAGEVDDFEFGLDLILDGVERLRTAAETA